MKHMIVLAALLLSSSALASELTCYGNGEKFNISVRADAITGDYGDLSRASDDPDCAYRENRYACYEDDGQVMINIPHALAKGTVKKGTVYIQSDTGDNADSHNHALLGVPYTCYAR